MKRSLQLQGEAITAQAVTWANDQTYREREAGEDE